MKFIKLDLLTLLIGLFLLSSCKDANTIGFELDPSLAIKGTLNSTVAVKSITIKDDATSTVALSRQPLGYLNGDPTFGTTEASLAFAVSLPSNGYSFGSNPIIDSAVLVLPYSRITDPATGTIINEFYGDTATSVYSFKVHQLKDDIALQTNFQSNREFAVETPVVGSFTAKIMPNTPVRVTDIVTGKPDTSRFIVPEIRIRLDNSFIQSRILSLDSVTRSRNSRFAAAFKGLRISVDKATTSGKGGIILVDFAGTNANLQLYYKKDVTNSINKDTVGVSFPIAIKSGPVAANIKHDYTGTPVETQLNTPNPATPYNVTYLQGLAGLRNKISFPDLTAFVNSVKAGNPASRIVINRAELVVNVANGTDALPYAPARKLILYRNDIAGNRLNLIDYSNPQNSNNPKYVGPDRAINGFYDATNKRYLFVLTSYLQNLIDGDTEDYGTFLSVTGFDEANLTPSILTARRSVINTTTPGSGNNAIKLNIYYTKVN
ncbi:MAG: DUF4270 domain-containing protein [Pedobacter sp.]